MERKIVQIAMAAYQGVGCIALCDDGTLWTKYGLLDDEPWKQIQAVPQPPLELDTLLEGVTDENKHEEEKL